MKRKEQRRLITVAKKDPMHSFLLKRIPVEVIEYPLELVLSVWATVSGLALMLGVSDPVSIAETLPDGLQDAWGIALTLSGATMGIGLMLRKYGTIVARGMSLLAPAALVYGISIFIWGGVERAIPAGPLLISIAVLCWTRAWWLTKREQILRYLAADNARGVRTKHEESD